MNFDKAKDLYSMLEKIPKEHLDFGRICNCPCHVDGIEIFCSCFMPCCNYEKKKYIDKDMNFDVKRFGAIIMNLEDK